MEITEPGNAPFPESNAGGTRAVWAEGDRIFAIDEPIEGDRTSRIANIPGLAAG